MSNLVSKTGLTLLVGIVLIAGTAGAQTPMAARNIGQRIVPDDARMVGRGGWGMAVYDTAHPGFKNLASLAFLRHVVLKYTGYGEVADAESAQGTRGTSGAYSPGIQVAVPVIKNRLGVTAGFSMVGSARWDAQRDTSFALGDTIISGGVAINREGTRFKVPLGVAWRLTDQVALSAAVNLESGSILENYNEAFGSLVVDPNLKETKDLFSGTSYTIGLLWQPFSRLSLGASWTPAYDLNVDRKVKVQGVTARFEDSWDMNLPAEFQAGFQVRMNNRWRLGADGHYMPFTKFSGNETWAAEMEDEYTLGFGLERRRANVRRAGMKNLPLRLGVNYHQWAYGLGGEPIQEYTFSVGTGFAFARDLGQLDISLSYGIIGDLEKNGVQSDVYRLGVSITGLEAWW